jgi:hypothetical protein
MVLTEIKEALDTYLLGSTPPTGLSLLLTSSAATVASLEPSLNTTLSQLSSAQVLNLKTVLSVALFWASDVHPPPHACRD